MYRTWAAFYEQRWRVPALAAPDGGWQAAFGSRLHTLSAYGSRCRTDSLFGHSGGVRACVLLPGRNLVVTGKKLPTVGSLSGPVVPISPWRSTTFHAITYIKWLKVLTYVQR